MIEKLSLGEPFLETQFIKAETGFNVPGQGILLNLDRELAIEVAGELSLPPLRSLVVSGATIDVPGRALLVGGAAALDLDDLTTLDCLRGLWKSNWQLTHNAKQRGVPYYKSPRLCVDGINMNYCLVSAADCPSGIHREHSGDVIELHAQIVGCGAVELLASADPASVYAALPLAAGGVHLSLRRADGQYPWHRYHSHSRCIFLALELPAE